MLIEQELFFDGQWFDINDGRDATSIVSVLRDDLGRWRAQNIIEVMEGRCKAKYPVVFHLKRHYERLLEACTGLYDFNKIPSEEEVAGKICDMWRLKSEFVVHLQVSAGPSEDLKIPLNKPLITLDVRSHTFGPPEIPIRLKSVPERRCFPEYKTGGGYGAVPRIMQKYMIEEGGFDSFIYWNAIEGAIEGPYDNLFFVTEDNDLVTSSVGVLHGVTRGVLLKLARESGIFKNVTERSGLHLAFIETCKEAFFTSTTKGINRIQLINDKKFETGPQTLTSRLHKLFLEYRENYYRERGA